MLKANEVIKGVLDSFFSVKKELNAECEDVDDMLPLTLDEEETELVSEAITSALKEKGFLNER